MKKYKIRKTFTYDGKRYQVYGDDEIEVAVKIERKKRDLEEGKVTLSGSTTVSDWVDICMDVYKPNLSDQVKSDMLYRIKRHILNEIGRYPIKSVTPLMCQAIMSKQADKSYSHIKKLYQELHFIFETAKKNHYILENPADDLSLPRGDKGSRRTLTEAERTAFHNVAEKYPPFILFELMEGCGCRPSEAMELKGEDISIIDDVPMLHIRGTKTKNSDRHVPIPTRLYDKIKQVAKGDYIAPSTSGRKHTDSSYHRLSDRLKREMNIEMGCQVYRNHLIEPLPLADDFVPYNFRHTYCTDLCRKGIDIRIAQRLMGHANIQITADIYTHIDMQDLTLLADVINK